MTQPLLLQVCELTRNLDDAVFGPLVYIWMYVSNVVQDVQHHRSVSSTHFVNDEVLVWEEIVLVVLHQVPRQRFSIVRREQLGRCMPQLAEVVVFLQVERILEVGVAMPQLLEEFVLRLHGVEVERVAGREDDDLLGEVAVAGVVQAVLNEIAHEHPHSAWSLSPAPQHV